jgi:prepilin-type N-terminal cleavage/methylation domain-containing protein
MNFPKKKRDLSNAAGISLIEVLVVMTLIGIVTSFALVNFRQSNRSFGVAGASRTLSTYFDKARIDAIRRHATASVTLNSTLSYTVNVDFDGTGTPTARTFTLPQGTTLSYRLSPSTTDIDPSATPITITYDWRGQVTSISNNVVITLADSMSGVAPSSMVVGLAGDISPDRTVTGPVTNPTPNTIVNPTSGTKNMNGN